MHARRISAVVLVILGAILMFLAPEMWPGIALLVAGILVEIVGIALEHNQRR